MVEEMEVDGNITSNHRKCRYRQLLNDVEDIDETEDTSINTVNRITTILQETFLLHDQCDPAERVKQLDETLLDHKVLSSATNILVKCTKALNLESITYEPADFCETLIESLGTDNDEVNFHALVNDVKAIIPDTLRVISLYGACDFTKAPEPKKKKSRERAEKIITNKKELIAVVNEKKSDDSEDTISFIYKVLKKECEKQQTDSLNYYDFIIDTSDFGVTVENIFYCSFLVREGKVGLIEEDGILKIILKSSKELEAYRKHGGVNSEWISSIDMDFWKEHAKEGYLQKYRQNET